MQYQIISLKGKGLDWRNGKKIRTLLKGTKRIINSKRVK